MDNDFLLEMGLRIKRKRLELGYSQEELGKRSGFKGRSAISMIELGLRDIAHDKVVAIAKALGVTPAYLMGWEEVTDYSLTNIESEYEMEIKNRLHNLSEGQLRVLLSLVKEMEGK